MTNKYIFISLILTSFLKLVISLPSDNIWNKIQSYIEQEKMFIKENKTNFIFDESNYLKLDIHSPQMKILYEKQEEFFKKYNNANFIFLVDNLDEKKEKIEEATFNLCKYLYKTYKINMENSILALFSIETRRVRIRTGENVKKKLTNEELREVINNLGPYLRGKHYYTALIKYMENINHYYTNDISAFYALLNLILFIIFMFCCLIKAQGEFNHEKFQERRFVHQTVYQTIRTDKNLKKIVTFLKKQKSNKRILTDNCAICLEEFKFKEVKINNEKNDESVDQEKKDFSGGDKKANEENDILVLECGHQFHVACIEKWMERKNECPLCRQKINNRYNKDGAHMVWGVQNEINNNLYEHIDYDDLFTNIIFNYLFYLLSLILSSSSEKSDYGSSNGSDYGGGASGGW